MKLSRTVSYALLACLQLAQTEAEASVPCSRLAAEGRMPERFLLQILRNLVTHGILRSARGVDGGYRLDRPPSMISLLELIEAVEGPINPTMPDVSQLPAETVQQLRQVLRHINDNTRRELEAIKLEHLLPPSVL